MKQLKLFSLVYVVLLSGFTTHAQTIAGGFYHSLTLCNDGTAMAWGANDWGQLGNGNNVSSNVPVQVSGLTDMVAIACGGIHSLALKNDGTVWAWGDNSEGQLGNGNNVSSNVPVNVVSLCPVAGTEESNKEVEEITIYPNPSSSNFTIETEENENFTARITNTIGQKVAEKKFQKKIEVDVSAFSKGLFLVEICDERGVKCHTEKILLE